MAHILHLETATHLCSVALARDGVVLATRDLMSAGFSHAEKLNVFIDEVLKETDVTMKELNAVAVGIGPGSFTGLRIGLSAAKGLCYALDMPIMGVGTLDTLVSALRASGHTQAGPVLWPMVDARRMEVFTQCIDGAEKSGPMPLLLSAEWVAGLDKSKEHFVFGDGADKAADLFAGVPHVKHLAGIRPVASAMCGLASDRFQRAAFDDLAYLVPFYGKEAGVTMAKKSI
ncbi:MAG: tRNA (adenosine(37)-N6)-threonylcarbamoyltransferase complex dimerization subunit type 1 TsaB [Flavobacteriales bacterium]